MRTCSKDETPIKKDGLTKGCLIGAEQTIWPNHWSWRCNLSLKQTFIVLVLLIPPPPHITYYSIHEPGSDCIPKARSSLMENTLEITWNAMLYLLQDVCCSQYHLSNHVLEFLLHYLWYDVNKLPVAPVSIGISFTFTFWILVIFQLLCSVILSDDVQRSINKRSFFLVISYVPSYNLLTPEHSNFIILTCFGWFWYVHTICSFPLSIQFV
jgi:hypothetical protein